MKHRILTSIIVFLIFLALGIVIFKIVEYTNYSETREYVLEEIENGKYVVYQRTVSSIPAQNYEIATMVINGSIVTVKGSVNFVFSQENENYVIIERTHIENGDIATIYISKDKVEYADTITVR